MSVDPEPPYRTQHLRLGVDNRPARTAMGWWTDLDDARVCMDLARIGAFRVGEDRTATIHDLSVLSEVSCTGALGSYPGYVPGIWVETAPG